MTLPLDCTRRRAPDERPQQILDAALAVFGEQGLAGARLDDIARRAGIAKGTIYLYFPNKEALFQAVVRETIVARLEEMTAEFGTAGRGTCTAQLRAYMRTWWASLRTPTFRTIYRLVIGELHRFPELMQFYLDEVVSRAVTLHAGVIERGIASGEFRPVDPRVTARVISSAFVAHSLWGGHPLPPRPLVGDMSDEAVLAQLEDFALHALRPDAAAPPA
jgi:AcrR family transcriptional regulator